MFRRITTFLCVLVLSCISFSSFKPSAYVNKYYEIFDNQQQPATVAPAPAAVSNNIEQEEEGRTTALSSTKTTTSSSRMLQVTFPLFFVKSQELEYLHYQVPENLAEDRVKESINKNQTVLWYYGGWNSLKKCDKILNALEAGLNNTQKLQEQFQLLDDDITTIHQKYILRVFISDSKDTGGGKPMYDCAKKVSNIIGNDNVYISSRHLTKHRDFYYDFHVSIKNQKNQEEEEGVPIEIFKRPFSDLNGTVWKYNQERKYNISKYIYNGVIAKQDFQIRKNYKRELDSIMANRSNKELEEITVDDYFVYSNRHNDVAHFWDVEPDNEYGQLRNRITQTLQSIIKKENLTGTAGLVSARSTVGRTTVQEAYAEALLDHKIIIIAQRDSWEDQVRLFEGMISGALIMSDPITHMPTGIEENKTIVIYHSLEDMKRKVLYYLKDPQGSQKRIEIARAGMNMAVERHMAGQHKARLLLGRWPTDLSNPVIPPLHGKAYFSDDRNPSF